MPSPAPGGCRGWAPAGPSPRVAPGPLTPRPRMWGAAPPTPAPSTTSTHSRGPPPPHITNTADELDPDGSMRAARLGRHAPIHLEPEHQSATPGGPPLERTVGMQYLEALFSDVVQEEDGDYWFHTPEGGWQAEEIVRARAPEVEAAPLSALRNVDAPDFPTRTPLSDLVLGTTVESAIVEGGALAAGILVDVGATWNGLLPVDPAQGGRVWRALKGRFPLGGSVSVRVARVDAAPLARFPLVLELVGADAELAACFLPAAAYRGAYDLRGAGDDPATLDALTGGAWSGGREFEVLNLPAGVYGAGDELSDEKVRLGYEVRASYPGGAAASAAAAADAAALEALRVAEEEGDGEAEEEGHGRVLEVGWTPFDGAAGSV